MSKFLRSRVIDHTKKPRGLGKLEWEAPKYVAATLLVGQNKGKRALNRKGHCAKESEHFNIEKLDRFFREAREAQLESRGLPKTKFMASRIQQEGWFEGGGEHSAAYTIIHTGEEGEETLKDFKQAMRVLAESVAKKTCQDEVLVVFETPEGKSTESYSAVPAPPRAKKKRRA